MKIFGRITNFLERREIKILKKGAEILAFGIVVAIPYVYIMNKVKFKGGAFGSKN